MSAPSTCWFSRLQSLALFSLSIFSIWNYLFAKPKLIRFDVDKRFTNAVSFGPMVFMSGTYYIQNYYLYVHICHRNITGPSKITFNLAISYHIKSN